MEEWLDNMKFAIVKQLGRDGLVLIKEVEHKAINNFIEMIKYTKKKGESDYDRGYNQALANLEKQLKRIQKKIDLIE